MTQPAANEELSAYLDGELEEVEVAELEARLAADPALRDELESLRAAADFLRTHGPVHAPPGFYGRVLDAVEDEPVPGAWWRWLRRPFGLPVEGLAVAAAAVVVLFFALDLGREAFEGPPLDAEPAAPVDKGVSLPGEDDAVAQPDTDDLVGPSVGEDKLDEAFGDAKIVPKEAIRKRTLGVDEEGTDAAPPEEVTASKSILPQGTSTAPEPGPVASGEEPLGATMPYSSYSVRSDDIYSLNQLQRIVGKVGGTLEVRAGDLTGKSGTVIEPGGSALVTVWVPTERLADFDRLLRQLGSVREEKGDPRQFISSDTVEIPLVIQVDASPKAIPTTQPAP